MVKLLDSAAMPSPFFAYRPRRVDREEFVRLMKAAHEKGILKMHVGHPSTARHISRISGIEVCPKARGVEVRSGDMILVCKLKYRLKDAGLKNDYRVMESLDEDDYEYWVVEVLDQRLCTAPRKIGIAL